MCAAEMAIAGVGVGVTEGVMENEPLGDPVMLADTLVLGVTLDVTDTDGEKLPERDGDADIEGVRLLENDDDPDGDSRTLPDELWVRDCVELA